MVFAGKVNLAHPFRWQQRRFKYLIAKDRFTEELFLRRAFAVHEPFIIQINVGQDIRIMVFNIVQITGNIRVEVMAENQLPCRVVYACAVGGDHKSADLQAVTDLRYIDMMTAGGKHKVHITLGQQLKCFFGIRRQKVVR
ncbi:Uncharacterised protein [Yersinia massiliensis]|nr:Uncharacterised protein [Yersinia massiliensis]